MSLHSAPDTLNPLLAPEVEQIIGPVVVFVQINVGFANDIEFLLFKSDALGVIFDMRLHKSRPVDLAGIDSRVRSHTREMPVFYCGKKLESDHNSKRSIPIPIPDDFRPY
jgi:hypothetical protein